MTGQCRVSHVRIAGAGVGSFVPSVRSAAVRSCGITSTGGCTPGTRNCGEHGITIGSGHGSGWCL